MDVYEAIRTVLAVRKYADRAVAHETVRKIVEAGRLTGSSKNGQPWHFVVVEDRDALKRLGAVCRTGPYTAEAAFAIAVAVEQESPYGMSDASRAIQSMALAAWEEGIGSNWVGFNNMPGVEELLGVLGTHRVVGVVPFGYPEARLGRGKKRRKPLGEVASSERFGEPFA